MGINGEKLKAFENERKLMNSWIITLQFQVKNQNKQTNKRLY